MRVEINICSPENYRNDEDEEYNKHCTLHTEQLLNLLKIKMIYPNYGMI